MTARIVIALALLAPSLARADGAVEEVSAGNSPQTAGNPASSYLSDRIAGFYEPNDSWQLRLDVTGTRDYTNTKQPATTGLFGPGDILLTNLAVEYDPDSHWSLKLAGSYSPTSAAYSSTTVQTQTMKGTVADANAQLESQTSSKSGGAWIGYETAGESNAETNVLLTATVNDFNTLQQITAVTDKAGQMLSVDQLRAYCAAHPCSPQLTAALGANSAELAQLVIDGNVSETVYKNTDVGIDGAYYLYDKDPTKVGYFSVASVGRTANFGAGIGIAPLQYTVMPSAIHRWGPLMAMGTFTYGHYVDNEGYNTTAAVRLQYKWKLDGSQRIKVWAKGSGARDVDSTHTATKSGSLALGVQYTW